MQCRVARVQGGQGAAWWPRVTTVLLSFPGADSELVLPDCLRPRSFTALRRPSLRREADEARLSVSLCDLNLPGADGDSDEAVPVAGCPIPQNSLNSQHSRALPAQLDGDLRFHALRAGTHVRILDEQTVARLDHGREERALVFTSRPVRVAETIFVKVTRSGGARPGALSFGVTTCDPCTLRPADLPFNHEALVDRKEFWAVCRVPGPLHSGDILGLVVNADGELHLSHNGAAAGMQLCVDASQPLWMLFSLHGAATQIRILGECPPYPSSIPRHSAQSNLARPSKCSLPSTAADPGLLPGIPSGPWSTEPGETPVAPPPPQIRLLSKHVCNLPQGGQREPLSQNPSCSLSKGIMPTVNAGPDEVLESVILKVQQMQSDEGMFPSIQARAPGSLNEEINEAGRWPKGLEHCSKSSMLCAQRCVSKICASIYVVMLGR